MTTASAAPSSGSWPEPPLPDGVRVVDYGIRGMHLAYDLLDAWDALVLVDAVPVPRGARDDRAAGDRPGARGHRAGVDAHGMDPVTVLATLAALGGTLPPRTLLVGCQVADTGEGMGLTPPVEAAVAGGGPGRARPVAGSAAGGGALRCVWGSRAG